jgi:hypothetical protein
MCFLSIVLISCQNNPEKEVKEEAVIEESSVSYAFYGEEIDGNGVVSYSEFEEMLSKTDTVQVKLAGTIDKTCTVKGCWMKVNVEGIEEPMHITFKDYGFFVPKEGMEEKQTIFEGVAYVDTLSVDMLRHYAEDEGQSVEEIAAINTPEVVVTFEAAGVLIQN